ncbi:MAG: DMT family transporter [Planctomycetaceae bacterium]
MTSRGLSACSVKHLPLSATSLALVLSCSLIWGGQAIAAKLAVNSVPPIMVLSLRFAMALPLLIVVAGIRRTSLRLSQRQLLLIVGNSVLVMIQLGLFLVGTGLTSTARSIVIVNTFPLFAAVAGHFLTNDAPVRRGQVAGLLIAFAGLSIVLLPRLTVDTSTSLTGDLVVLTAAVIIGFKIAWMRRILGVLDPIQVVVWSSLLGAPLCFLLSLGMYDVASIRFSVSSLGAIAYQGILVSGFAVLAWTYLLSQHAVNNLTVFRLATPPIGMFLGWMLLSESLDGMLLVGGALIVAGIWSVHRTAAQSAVGAAAITDKRVEP